MPKNLLNRWYALRTVFLIILVVSLIGIVTFYHWVLGVISIILLLSIVNFIYRAELQYTENLQGYIETITYRVKKAGTDVVHHMPIGIILYDEDKKIEWYNQYVTQIVENDQLSQTDLHELFPNLEWDKDWEKSAIKIKNKVYQVEHNMKERLLYLTDITELMNLTEKYESEKSVIGIIHLDNLDEVGQGMDELSRNLLLTDVSTTISDWASELGIYLKRYTADKFFFITTQSLLDELEGTRFDILDNVRDLTSENNIPLTLSIGIGAGADSLIKLGEDAQSSLDIALGRGGDQAAVKFNEQLIFYGGKTNAVEKRTRVRARVISHAIRDIIKGSDNILIMGHKNPDMDALGSAIGILKAVLVNGKKGYIVLNESNLMIENLLDEIAKNKELTQYFITSEAALNIHTQHTLLIMVDTHKPSLTIEPKLVEQVSKKVVIDHHRRGEEFVVDPVLVYIEPYASSTSELVTELLQYQTEKLKMEKLEATSLLAGIYVDTKNFTYRTGARTFEAASFLKANGADTTLVQKILKEEIEQYIKKADIVKQAKIIFNTIAIAVSSEKLDQILIAKAADTLLNMKDVHASFVISLRKDNLVSISARSSGQVNVQVIMERLGGGGHLTNAAVQLEGVSLEEVEIQLIEVLEQVQQEGGFKK